MHTSRFECIYLHGFASGPKSVKAQFFAKELSMLGLKVHVPNLAGTSFADMTITSQVQLVDDIVSGIESNKDIFVIGSSMGGVIAVLSACKHARIKSLFLLAPGFGLNKRWHEIIGEHKFIEWKANGFTSVFNYAAEAELPFNYSFVEDADKYVLHDMRAPVPTTVVHGIHDTTVPPIWSEEFAKVNPDLVDLHLVDDDHSLIRTLPGTWKLMQSILEKRFDLARSQH